MKKILVIEDEENNLLLITRLLERAGFEVLSERTGRAGIETARNKKPDAVLLDIGLPDVDGTEVLDAIRNSPANGELTIIAMTSFAMAGDRERLLARGCSGYIEKPYEPEEVVRDIRAIMEKSRAGRPWQDSYACDGDVRRDPRFSSQSAMVE